MTVDELRDIVFEALCGHRDRLSIVARAEGYSFFVGRQGDKIIVFGGASDPPFLIDVVEGQIRS